ncbi:MAG: SlyX family protein [Hyphomicrobiales bacterium]|nr:SlyX family protein [Hyphomicrobiales bacterium]
MSGQDDPLEALTARADTLEATMAYQAEAIEDLNRTITAQWKIIDGLKRGLDVLSDRVQEAESRSGLAAPEPPPPHY